MSDKLMKCPSVLCGSEEVYFHMIISGRGFVKCADCGCSTSNHPSHLIEFDKALEYWNTRPESSPAQEWISVEDRLPDCEGEYLIYTDCAAIDRCRYGDHGCPYFINSRGYKERVTHWQPLPNAPKMQGENNESR